MSPAPSNLLSVLNALPGATLLLTPDLRIVAASDTYLAATLTQRDTLVGQHLFDAFPDNPQAPDAHATRNLRASLEQVLATGQPHDMPPQHYDVPDPARPGHFAERHWLPRNQPVPGPDGQVQYLLHTVTDITASRHAQQQLRDSQARELAARAEAETERALLQAVLTQAPLSIGLFTGDDLRVVAVSNVLADAVGSTVAQLVGRPLLEGAPELRGQGIDVALRQVMATHVALHEAERPAVTRRAGERHTGYYNAVYQSLYAADGPVIGVMSVAAEVTEQVHARQQLQQLNQALEARVEERAQEALALQADALAATQRHLREREEFYQVFEQAPVIVALLRGPEHFFHYRNPAFQALFPGRALTGLLYADVMPEIVAAGLMAELDRVYATGQPYYGTALPVVAAPPDGSAAHQRYYDFSYQPYREAGRIVGISIFAYDVTEQVLARQEREEQQRRLYAAFEQAPIGIAIQAGPDLVYEFVNPAYQRMVPGRELPGRRFFDVFAEMKGTAVETLLRRVYETGETQQEQDLLIPVARADGSPELDDRYFTIVYQARRDEDGRINGILAFVMEVTAPVLARQRVQELNQELAASNGALQAANEELNGSNTQLLRTNVDLDNFIYTASHDLKAPITNIEGLLDTLRHELPDPAPTNEVPFILDLMQDSVERFKRTIDHLTEVSKLQQAHAPDRAAVDLAAVVEDVRLDLAPLLRESNAELHVHLDDLPTVPFSEKNLRSVVFNLLSNAVKYRHPDRRPHVDVRAHQRPGFTVLEVHDNGLGLAPHQLPQLFGMFQRFHDHVPGTGIGLYMVKRMVENAGGRLEVHSQLGAGTSFFVYLPR